MEIQFIQILSLFGAFLILLAFAGNGLGYIKALDPLYLWPNLIGGLILTYTAWVEKQYGFFILEFVWFTVSAYSLIKNGIIKDKTLKLNI